MNSKIMYKELKKFVVNRKVALYVVNLPHGKKQNNNGIIAKNEKSM